MEEKLHFESIMEISTNNLWGSHFRVPQLIAQVFTDAGSRRVVCTLNDQITYQCAILSSGDGGFVITVNKKNQTQLGLKPGSRVQVSLHADHSEYGLPMPEEMAELLQQDEAGNRLFHALTPGKQRTLLYIIGQPKKSDTRLARALVIVEHLKESNGKVDYKLLNAQMKQSRN
jgi:hypothetical protein